jgi:hypothetical protein
LLVSPCTLCPPGFRPSLAGCAAGVKFLLLHLPRTTPLEEARDAKDPSEQESLLRGRFNALRKSRSARRIEPPPLCKVVEKRTRLLPGFRIEIIFDMENYLAQVTPNNYPIRLEPPQILSKHFLRGRRDESR